MQLVLEENEWGYRFNPETFLMNKLSQEEDLDDGTYLVIKQKEYIEDIDRSVIQTTYGFIKNEGFQILNKREFSKYLSERCAEYILSKNKFPANVKLEKPLREKKPLYLKYIGPYDIYHLKITKEMLEDKEPYEFFTIEMAEVLEKLKEQDEAKYKIEYAKSSRSTCKKCKEKITKGEVRIGKPSFFNEHLTYKWHHENCFYLRQLSKEDIEGLDNLEVADKERILQKLSKF